MKKYKIKKIVNKKKEVNKMIYIHKANNQAKMANIKTPDFARLIEDNNRVYNEYIKKMQAHTAKIQKAIDDRDNGIEPDPEFVKSMKDHLIGAGIIDADGNLTEPYRRNS